MARTPSAVAHFRHEAVEAVQNIGIHASTEVNDTVKTRDDTYLERTLAIDVVERYESGCSSSPVITRDRCCSDPFIGMSNSNASVGYTNFFILTSGIGTRYFRRIFTD
jgi:hypothetical protein